MLLCSPCSDQIFPWRQATFVTVVPVETVERIVASFHIPKFDQFEAEINLGAFVRPVKASTTTTRECSDLHTRGCTFWPFI